MMDTMMRGLAAPQGVYALGRPDIGGIERPGAALMALVLDSVRSGSFERPAAQPRSGLAAHSRRPAPEPSYERPDFGVFDMDEGDDLTL